MKEITIKTFKFNELSDSAKEKAREWYRLGNDGDDFWSECSLEEAEQQGILLGITFKERQRKNMKGEPLPGKPCIWFSGFWSQGDGACFEGTWRARGVKADEVADGWGEDPATTEIKRIADVFSDVARKFPNASFTVIHRGHYNNEYCTSFDVESGVDKMSITELERWKSGDDASIDPTVNPEWEEVAELWRDRCEDDFPEDQLIENARDFMRWIYRQLEKEYEYQNSDKSVDENIIDNEYDFLEDGGTSFRV